MKAFLLAAGLGTRLRPFTNHHPKALAKVNGITLLERTILYLKKFGITEMVINIHHHGDQLVEFLKEKDNFGCKIDISDESDGLLETGGGLLKAKPFLKDSPFIIFNTDILTHLNISDFIAHHQKNKALVSLAVSDRESSRKLLFDKDLRLSGWKNEKTGETKITREIEQYIPLAFSGIHLVEPEIFELIEQKGKFSIIDPYLSLSKEHVLTAFDHTGTLMLDIGKPEAIAKAEEVFK